MDTVVKVDNTCVRGNARHVPDGHELSGYVRLTQAFWPAALEVTIDCHIGDDGLAYSNDRRYLGRTFEYPVRGL